MGQVRQRQRLILFAIVPLLVLVNTIAVRCALRRYDVNENSVVAEPEWQELFSANSAGDVNQACFKECTLRSRDKRDPSGALRFGKRTGIAYTNLDGDDLMASIKRMYRNSDLVDSRDIMLDSSDAQLIPWSSYSIGKRAAAEKPGFRGLARLRFG